MPMADQHDDATREFYFLARLEIDINREWNSLHLNCEDAERQLKAVAAAWGVEFTPDGEPAYGFRRYGVEEVPVMQPDECGVPEELEEVPITKEELTTWRWLIDRGGPGGLSADEMADDFGITSEVAALRLAGITALDMAHEVSAGRYRAGSKDDY